MTPNPTDRDGLVERLHKLADAMDSDNLDDCCAPAWRTACGRYGKELRRLLNSQAAAALREDARDSARLDWLDQSAHCADWAEDEPLKRVIDAETGKEFHESTWRAAIDAAMQTPSGDGGGDQERTHG